MKISIKSIIKCILVNGNKNNIKNLFFKLLLYQSLILSDKMMINLSYGN